MQLNEPQEYELRLLSDGKYSVLGRDKASKFSKPASARGIAKLYTLSSNGKLFYVGIAQQPMASRLNYGFKANGKGGYHGYKWKHLTDVLRLTVWTAHSDGEYVAIRELETVEAEVAFLCRQNSGQWPEFQHEIHFYQSLATHRLAAERVYNHAIRLPCH
jgi:hypothetical protein